MAQLTVPKRGAQLLQKLTARNSFYNILINVPDNSALSSARELNGISRPLRTSPLLSPLTRAS